MGFLMLAGLFGTLGYMGYYAKQEARAIKGDKILQPTGTPSIDKKTIENNFKLICQRGNAKIDKNNNPVHKNHYKPCVAYLQYQGFTIDIANYFKELYLEKYNRKYAQKIKQIKDRHWILEQQFYNEYDMRETKVVRYWNYGDTEKRCQTIMNNWLWSCMVERYNIVKDGNSNVEVWVISAPPSILKQIDKIYNEVCYLEFNRK